MALQELKQSGYLVLCLKEIVSIDKHTFLSSYNESEPIVQFYKRLIGQFPSQAEKGNFPPMFEKHFSRLQKIASRYYYYYLDCTGDNI